jgi:hypothetical protein
VRRIRRYWIFRLDLVNAVFGMILVPASILSLVGVIISAYFVKPPVLLVFVSIVAAWALWLAVKVLQGLLLFNLVRCPKCGFNPTRRKSDGRWMSPRTLHPRLQQLEECPECGFAGD